jgi:tetratricopeptide (TPR) repeat protein
MRHWELAARHFVDGLRADPWNAEALLGLAEALEAMGQRAEARQRRGVAYVAQGKLPQALAEFRALKALQPDSRETAILISQTLIQMQRNADAANEIKSVLARYPQDGDLRERLAQLYVLSHSRGPAQRLCEQWRKSDPAAAEPLWLLGRIALVTANQLPQAIGYFEQAVRLAPQDPESLFALGEALTRPGPQRDPQRALALLGQAVELSPAEARYRYQLGHLLQQMDQPEAARRQFLRALDQDPEMTAAYTGLIQISGKLRETGQVSLFAPIVRTLQEEKRAEAELRRRIYRSLGDAGAYAALARHLDERGELKAARAQWEVVLALKPADAPAREALARLDQILAVPEE